MSEKITYSYTCKNSFGRWTDTPENIKNRRCLWNCNCNGKGIKITPKPPTATK